MVRGVTASSLWTRSKSKGSVSATNGCSEEDETCSLTMDFLKHYYIENESSRIWSILAYYSAIKIHIFHLPWFLWLQFDTLGFASHVADQFTGFPIGTIFITITFHSSKHILYNKDQKYQIYPSPHLHCKFEFEIQIKKTKI